MKLKKLLKNVLLAGAVSAVFSAGAAEARFYNISEPQVVNTGSSATVTAGLTDISEMEGSVQLIAVSQNRTTGKVNAIAVDKKEITGDSVSLSATVNTSAGDEIKYFVTDEKGGSLFNLKPSAIKNFRVIPKLYSVGAQWDASSDDSGEVEYIVYKDGAEYTRTSETSIKYSDISDGQTCSFSVEAVDKHGLKSARSESGEAGLYEESFVDFHTNENTGITFRAITNGGQDGFAVPAIMDGMSCYRNALVGEEGYSKTYNSFLYFLADRKNVDQNVRRVAVVIDYFDNESGALNIMYNAENGENKRVNVTTFTGTNKWKRTAVILEDAKFVGASTLTNSDLRLEGTTTNIYIKRVAIMPAENYDEIGDEKKAKFFIASDSIAALWTSGKNVGWGMVFGKYLNDEKAFARNQAVSGSSTRTFRENGYWQKIMDEAKAGDYVLICFGHNDSEQNQKNVPLDEYKEYLREYIRETRDKGATPIILTSIPQYDSGGNRMLYNLGENLMNYRNASLEVASEMGVASFDSAKAMYDTFMYYYNISPTQTHTKYLGMYNDEGYNNRTHITQSGAELLANLIANGIYSNESLSGIGELMTVYEIPKDEFTPEEPTTPDEPDEPGEPDEPVVPDVPEEPSEPEEDFDDGKKRIYIMGDSVAAEYGEDSQTVGWATKLATNFDAETTKLINLSAPGTTTQNNTAWDNAKVNLNAGDYVFIALGYDDAVAETDPESYKAKLAEYISEIKEKEATPVIITVLPEYNSTSRTMTHFADYRNAAIAAAEEAEAVCFDIAKTVKSEFDKLKISSASKAHSTFIKRYAASSSNKRVLLSDEGAEYIAGLIADAISSEETFSDIQ